MWALLIVSVVVILRQLIIMRFGGLAHEAPR